MAGCAPIRHTDRRDGLTRNRHADRRMLLLLCTLGSIFLPIRSYKEDDIIPVLIGQQEGGGRRRAAGTVVENMKENDENKRKCKC